MQNEVTGVFKKGQSWQGSYFCTQGRTQFSLDITDVTMLGPMLHNFRACLFFSHQDIKRAELLQVSRAAKVSQWQGADTSGFNLHHRHMEECWLSVDSFVLHHPS